MTVSSQTSTATFVGNGVATVFPLPFRFFNNSDVFAYFIDSVTGASTPMVLGIDYSLSGAGEPEVDGNALSTLTTAVPLASMRGLYVERVMPQVQETDIVNQGEFFASTHEDVFDRLTMLIQQSNANSEGAIRVAIGDPEPRRLPPAAQRINKLMTFDDTGEPSTEFYNPGDAAGLSILLADQTPGTEGARLVGYTGRTVFAKLSDYISVADYGAVGDGVTNDTAAFTAALATRKNVYVPQGVFLITDRLVVNPGQTLYGAGRQVSTIKVNATFNMAANSIIRLAIPGEEVTRLMDIEILCYQDPSTPNRAALIAYPPAVYADNCSRFEIDKVRIAGAIDGIIATGNCGGAFIGRLEVGCFGTGLKFDGALDFVRIESYHFWPFAYPSGNLVTIYEDGTTVAAEFGHVDGLNIGSLTTYKGRVKFTSSNLTPIGAALPACIANLQLDGEGAIYEHTGGNGVQVACCYSTKDSSPTATLIVTNGRAEFGFFDLNAANTVTPILVNGGQLYINGGKLRNLLVAGKLAEVTSGTLSIRNSWFDVPNNTRTVPYVEQSGTGILHVTSCTTTRHPGISGPLVKIGADLAGHTIIGNSFLGFTLDIATDSLLGAYGPNRCKSSSFTPIVEFATNGDFNPTYAVQQGKYWYTENGIAFDLRVEFSTNAYSTSSGGFRVSGMPVPLTNDFDFGAITIGLQSNFTLTGGFTSMQAVSGVTSQGILLRQAGSTQTSNALFNANVPASTAGFQLTLSGEINTQL
jgi:hypothetical protein